MINNTRHKKRAAARCVFGPDPSRHELDLRITIIPGDEPPPGWLALWRRLLAPPLPPDRAANAPLPVEGSPAT
jgi:hypothetical protein